MVLELEARQVQVQRILQSKAFRTSEVQRNLLAYLAERSIAGAADSLKEYTVGLDVFAKPASYDPRQESTVRMHVGRLRQKLAEYYRSEGTDDPIIVDLPKGGFKVVFEARQPDPRTESAAARSSAKLLLRHRLEIALAAACVVAIGFAAFFAMRLWTAEQTTAASPPVWTPELKELWAPIVSSNRPLVISLSTVSAGSSSFGTASGAFLLGQFLGQQKKDIQLTPSDQLSMPEIAMGNVVVVGPQNGNSQIRNVPIDQQLVLEPNGIRNLKPNPGEPAFLADRPPKDPQDAAESYALISHVPGLVGNGEVLYFCGNQIPAVTGAVEAFTNPNFARTLVSKMKDAAGNLPRYYQLVLRVRSMDDMPIDFAYVFHRDLPAGKTSSK